MNIDKNIISNNIKQALAEDLADQQDITALLVPDDAEAKAYVIAKEDTVLCGQAWVNETFAEIDPNIKITWLHKDGDIIEKGSKVYELKGNARNLLTGERTALNFLQLLSSTASITHIYAQQLQGTNTKLLDSRKTIPGLRIAQKYAVTCGGGKNHRMGLYDAFLIKENHIRACGSITKAITAAKAIDAEKPVEIEVETIIELKEALTAKADIIMLDNFSLEDMHQAVTINNHQAKLEASGDITLENIRAVAKTGVDYISVGALTKNVKAIDFSMLFNQ